MTPPEQIVLYIYKMFNEVLGSKRGKGKYFT